MKKFVAIVDAFSSGAMFPEYFKGHGVDCLHVQSLKSIPDVYAASFHAEDFVENIVHEGNKDATIDRLKKYSPIAVIAGIESGVELADELSEAMGLLSNGTAQSSARRDKFDMVKALEVSGVPHAKSAASSNLDEILKWIGRNTTYPVVIKPPKSAGTDNVSICENEKEVREAFAAIYGKKNRLDILNSKVMVQEFLDGIEYIVDSVSLQGNVVVANYEKVGKLVQDGARVYETVELEPFDSPAAQALYPYACEVLKALGIQHGPAHMELMLTKNGPRLIEVGARLDGCRAPEVVRKALGTDQCEITVDYYLNPQAAMEKWVGYPFKIQRHHRRVFLISDTEGTFEKFGYEPEIENLPSFNKFNKNIAVGKYLYRTSNLFNTPGYIDLFHEDLSVVLRDVEQIRQWEQRDGFYQVAQAADRAI